MQLLNTTEELKSFPSTQSILLYSDIEIDQSFLDLNIILFRLQDESNVKLAEPYTYSLGYLKETFDKVSMDYKSEPYNNGFKITCTPKQPLNLDSKFCIYISNKLRSNPIQINKVNSQSPSSITVSLKDNDTLNVTSDNNKYVLNILESSSFKFGKNLIKYSINNNDPKQIDARSDSNTIILPNITIQLRDMPYIKGESFEITLSDSTSGVDSDYQYILRTVASKSIKPISALDRSNEISNQAILDFYKKKEANTPVVPDYVLPKYIDTNIFAIKIPEGYRIDLDGIKKQLTIAFNNYLLKSMKLYDPTHKYKVLIHHNSFNNECIFEVLYTDDKTQTDVVVIDNKEDEWI